MGIHTPSAVRHVLSLAITAAFALSVDGAMAQNKKEEPCLPGKPCSNASTDKPPPKPAAKHTWQPKKKPSGPHAITPGFRMLPGGGSRVFVQLNQSVSPQLIKTPGLLTYVLRGFHVPVHNSKHALQTHFFNTPVSDVRLQQTKDDTRLVIQLRTAAEPTVQLVETEPGRVWELRVDFPAGAYRVATHDAEPPKSPHPDHHDHHKKSHHNHKAAPSSNKSPQTVLGPPSP